MRLDNEHLKQQNNMLVEEVKKRVQTVDNLEKKSFSLQRENTELKETSTSEATLVLKENEKLREKIQKLT